MSEFLELCCQGSSQEHARKAICWLLWEWPALEMFPTEFGLHDKQPGWEKVKSPSLPRQLGIKANLEGGEIWLMGCKRTMQPLALALPRRPQAELDIHYICSRLVFNLIVLHGPTDDVTNAQMALGRERSPIPGWGGSGLQDPSWRLVVLTWDIHTVLCPGSMWTHIECLISGHLVSTALSLPATTWHCCTSPQLSLILPGSWSLAIGAQCCAECGMVSEPPAHANTKGYESIPCLISSPPSALSTLPARFPCTPSASPHRLAVFPVLSFSNCQDPPCVVTMATGGLQPQHLLAVPVIQPSTHSVAGSHFCV